MRRYLFIAFVMSLNTMPAAAQTWETQQQMYNEKANLESELFHQREEMERMRQENAKALEEKRRDLELQKLDLQQRNQKPQFRDNDSLESSRSQDNVKNENALVLKKRIDEEQAFVWNEQASNPLIFNSKYFTHLYMSLSAQDIQADKIQAIIVSTKAFWIRKAKAAKQGNTVAQREMGIAYLEKKELEENSIEAVKWLKLAGSKNDEVACSYLDRMKMLAPEYCTHLSPFNMLFNR